MTSESPDLLSEPDVPEALRDTAAGRAPAFGLRALGLAAALFLIVIGGMEAFARSEGIPSSPSDSPDGWARAFERALADPDAIALVGSSRGSLGFEPAVLAERTGRPVANLTINGGNGLPALERLDAEGFAGTVLMEAMERRIFSPDARGRANTERYLAVLDDPSPIQPLERDLRVWLSERLRTRSSRSLETIVQVARGKEGGPPPRTVREDRFYVTDVSRIDRARLVRRWVSRAQSARPMNDAEADALLEGLGAIEARLRARGGRLIWVRLPVSGEVAAIEEAKWPRATTFDRLPGERWHADDHAETAALECFDGSHLAPDDAATLSEVLAREL